MVPRAKELVELAASAEDQSQLERVLFQFRDRFGLAHAAYHALSASFPHSDPVLMITYPNEWIDRYREQNYFEIDPILMEAPKAVFPIDWTEVSGSSPELIDFFGDAARHGVGKNGMSFPLRTVAGEKAAFTITSHTNRVEWESMRWAHVQQVWRFADAFHRRIVKLRFELDAPLSSKESECLKLLMSGSTPKAAASILGVSETRVRTILHQACRKLNCRTATQAVAVAVSRQLLA